MMSKKRLFYFLFPLLGIAGFFLRTVQLRFGFEPTTKLAVIGFPPGIMLLLLAAVLFFAAFFFVRMLPAFPDPPDFPERRSTSAAVIHFAAAGLTALMGILLLVSGLHGSRLDLLLGLVSVLTALYLLLISHAGKKLRAFCLIENTLFYVAWLVVLFSRHASDPVLMGFWPPLLALCAAVFGFYLLACAACGLNKPRRCLFSLLLGGSLCLIAAADGCSLSAAPYFCGFLAAALRQFFYAYRLLLTVLK